jgi:hypothetical protein
VTQNGESNDDDNANVSIQDTQIELVQCTKFLGIMLDDQLSFNQHIDYVISKANSRFYTLLLLKRQGVSSVMLSNFYCCVIRSVLVYAVPCFLSYLKKAHISKLEAIQSKCTKIILPSIHSYTERLEALKIPRLENFMQDLTIAHFYKILHNENHPLFPMLPAKQSESRRHSSRLKDTFIVNTKSKSFFTYCVQCI